jgi:hypothetical protein
MQRKKAIKRVVKKAVRTTVKKAAISCKGNVVTVNCKSPEEAKLVVTKVAKAMKKYTRKGENITVEIK